METYYCFDAHNNVVGIISAVNGKVVETFLNERKEKQVFTTADMTSNERQYLRQRGILVEVNRK